MDQIRQIEAHIDDTRERLGANFQELERRVESATDWRQHFEARPFTMLGIAFTGGVLLAALIRGKTERPVFVPSEPRSFLDPATKSQALDAWDSFKGAAISLGVSRLRSYVDELVPGFDEHFQKAERTLGERARPRPASMGPR